MDHKSFDAKIKAAGTQDGLAEGQFRALVSVFGNKDSYGDVVVPGAFTDTLAAWKAKGDPIPVYYSHRMDDPDYCIGEVLEAAETKDGLEVLAQLDLDAGGKAATVYRLLKGRRITQFSFSYDVRDGAWVEEKVDGEDQEWYELRKVDLYEVGPTPIGANQQTELLAVKAAAQHVERFAKDVQSGRVLTKANVATLGDALALLRDSASNIEGVLAAVGGGAGDTKASEAVPVKSEDPVRDNDEEPNRPTPSDLSTLLSIELATL